MITALAWVEPIRTAVIILRLVDGLDAICVVESDFRVRKGLGDSVDAAIDDAKRVKMNEESVAILSNGLVGDSLVLLFEEGGKGWTISSTVLLPKSVLMAVRIFETCL